MPNPLTRRNFMKALGMTSVGFLAACVSDRAGLSPAPNPAQMTPEIYLPLITTPAYKKIKNILFFIQENHTFDSLFANFPGANGQFAGQTCLDALPSDPPHSHAAALLPNSATTEAANCSYPEAQIPNYWQLARNFALCDNFFSEMRGPSHPNYFLMVAGQTPTVLTPSPTDLCPDYCLDIPSLPNRLDEHGLTWKDYGGLFSSFQSLYQRPEVMNYQDAQFFTDAENGTLPQVAWLNAGYLTDGDAKSGHPPASMCGGENYAVQVLNAAMNSPQWPEMAIFLVWDDWGGFFDHVTPPNVENWTDGTLFRYGYRVPCLVLSPYARAGYVSHTLYSLVSLLKFAETVFDLAPLTSRDASANDMLDCFDFNQAPLPPTLLSPRACS